MSIKDNILQIQQNLKNYPNAELMAVSKYRSLEEIQEVLKYDIKILGENRVQEAEQKFPHLNAQKHLIGHLQKNKIKKAIEMFDQIDSADSMKLITKIDQEAQKKDIIYPILIQINISRDENKYGFLRENFLEIIPELKKLKNINIRGLMTIPRHEEDPQKTAKYFQEMRMLYLETKNELNLQTLSMGMSQDYKIALDHGSNLIRVGSLIFELMIQKP